MKVSNCLSRLGTAVGATLLAACSASLQTAPQSELSADLSSFSSAVVRVSSSTAEDMSKDQSVFGAVLLTKINDLHQFRSVTLGDSAVALTGALLIKVDVADIRKVSQTKRLILGAFAGRAHMTASVEFLDGSSSRSLGVYTVKGQSGGTGYSGGTGEASDQMAAAIAQLISSHRSRGSVAGAVR